MNALVSSCCLSVLSVRAVSCATCNLQINHTIKRVADLGCFADSNTIHSTNSKSERRTRSDEGTYSESYSMSRGTDGSYRSHMSLKKRSSNSGAFTLPKVQRREFEVSKKLGEGSFGQVLYARWMTTGQQVALKVLKEEEAFGNQLVESGVLYEDIVACFEQEVSIMEYCGNHPNIVGLFAKGYDGRVLVMEHCRTDIYRIVKKSGTNLPIRSVRKWGRQILEAIQHIHSMGVIHQDVKSSNILVTEDGNAKICDFGLAMKGKGKIMADRELLTLWYRAPELLMGSKMYTNKVDEWGVGVIMLEMLHGKVPFNGDPKTRCSCRHMSHVNFNADQLSRIFQTMGTPDAEDLQPMACKAHFMHWPKHEFKLDEMIRVAIQKRRQSKDAPAEPEEEDAYEDDEAEEVKKWVEIVGGLLAVMPDRRDSCEEALNSRLFGLSSPAGRPSHPASHLISPFSLSQPCDTPPPLGLAMGIPINVRPPPLGEEPSEEQCASSPDSHEDEGSLRSRAKSLEGSASGRHKEPPGRKQSGVGRFLPAGWSFMRKRNSMPGGERTASGSGDSVYNMPIPVLELGDANVN